MATVLLGYGAFQAKNFVQGPTVRIESPRDGVAVHDSFIEIRGTAKNVSYLTLNGDKIFTDEAGTFTESRLLSPGYNIVTIGAKDRFGRTSTETLHITYNP